jgi:hypothetical protein
LILSAMYHVQNGLLDTRLQTPVTQGSIRWSHYSELPPCMLMILMDWGILLMDSLTILSTHCVAKPLLSYSICMMSAPHWLTPTPALSSQMPANRVGIRIVLVSAATDISNQKASHYILGFRQWSIIEWWISNTHYWAPASGVLNISSRLMRCSGSGEEGVLKVLEIVSNVDRLGW